ncbi:MAG: hypothetical protein U9N37_05290 [Thermodesulfobacteriota bacterium]|nr:hypothetical protein [Thermodesulfobacteriota bacterium]
MPPRKQSARVHARANVEIAGNRHFRMEIIQDSIMKIEILGTESLGVRGMCCLVSMGNRKILIDPGIALGYTRHGLLPHPFQVAVDEKIQGRIVDAWSSATDIVISHFHGDHIPLINANPYQLGIEKIECVNQGIRVWAKSRNLSPVEQKRKDALSAFLNMIPSEELRDRVLSFSGNVHHGDAGGTDTVVMTRIEGNLVFVHASDIQLLGDEAVSQILSWKPDVVFASGPPLYLERLSNRQVKLAWKNAIRLSRKVKILILDHHLMRGEGGAEWLDRLSLETGNEVMCGADFMEKPRMLLEAKRRYLYEKMPVPEGWHGAYARGKVNTGGYKTLPPGSFQGQ